MQKPTIRARVSERTITKVTRLFNGTLEDILTELLQNARRAGASQVSVSVNAENADNPGPTTTITVTDDGRGIVDPQSILSLGESGWTGTVIGEDPAGMGFFSLAGKAVAVTSRAKGNPGWRAQIHPDDWTGDSDIEIQNAIAPIGTMISFAFDMTGSNSVQRIVGECAKYYPLQVTLDGQHVDQHSWTQGAIHTANWRGSTIAVFDNHGHHRFKTLNFFGLTIQTKLPFVRDTGSTTYDAIVDIAPNSGLGLVLPARKEIIQNEAYEDLKQAIKRAIYEAIARNPSHSLAYNDWLEADQLGISLAEASPFLTSWTPETANYDERRNGRLIPAAQTTIIAELDPLTAQCLDRAIQHSDDPINIACAQPGFTGYTWYDALPRIKDVEFITQRDDEIIALEGHDGPPNGANHQELQNISARLHIVDGTNDHFRDYPTDIAAIDGNDCFYWLDTTKLYWRRHDAISPDVLADLLERALFSPSDDSASDSYETQQKEFRREAQQVALATLGSPHSVIAYRMRSALENELWGLTDEQIIHITVTRNGIDVKLLTTTATTIIATAEQS
jgi:Histidine kinase-, DNA gyrase B-, and HSP90-like ATPase